MTNIILNMTLSVDGFITTKEDPSHFLSHKEDSNFSSFYERIGAIVMGRRAYDYLKEQAPDLLSQKQIFVITHYLRQQEGKTIFIHENIAQTIRTLKNSLDKDIWVMGGAQIANMLLKENLIDKLILTTAPLIVGGGIRLFADDNPTIKLKHEETTTFNGFTQSTYSVL